MPVLSEETKHSFSPFTYLFLLGAVLLLSYSSWVLLKRRRISRTAAQQLPSYTAAKNEKEGLLFQDSPTPPSSLSPKNENLNLNLNFQRPPQPLPFTPPTPASNQEYYSSSPMQDFTHITPESTTPSETNFVTSPISQSPPETFDPTLPRRRSYTKQTPSGAEVSGEIITGEGWRRHTRVFGGGVCKACEESDRRMTA
jgi:hypothetical protein